MNKIKFITAKVMCTSLYILLSLNILHAKHENVYSEVNESDLKTRIENLHSEVDLRYTNEVHNIINTYIKRYRKGSERLLGLSEQYFPLYETEFAKQGIPQELKYLSIVESGLKPTAISVSGAVGLWQFMSGTAKLYGLRITSAVDERKDPIRSTQAASQYLKDLHEQFGDWTLALAAYNCGPGNVRKAIRRSQKEDFWNMKNYLPKETRRYIPKYVAVSYLMNYSHVHDLHPEYPEDHSHLATIEVYDYASFTDISKATGLPKSEIAKWNPSYKKWYIPRSSKGYFLTLPREDMMRYLAKIDDTAQLSKIGRNFSIVASPYILSNALKKQRVEVSTIPIFTKTPNIQLEENNPLDTPIRIGMVITPVAPIEHAFLKMYQLKPEESLLDVALSKGVKLSRLIELNNIDLTRPPAPGSSIRLE